MSIVADVLISALTDHSLQGTFHLFFHVLSCLLALFRSLEHPCLVGILLLYSLHVVSPRLLDGLFFHLELRLKHLDLLL